MLYHAENQLLSPPIVFLIYIAIIKSWKHPLRQYLIIVMAKTSAVRAPPPMFDEIAIIKGPKTTRKGNM